MDRWQMTVYMRGWLCIHSFAVRSELVAKYADAIIIKIIFYGEKLWQSVCVYLIVGQTRQQSSANIQTNAKWRTSREVLYKCYNQKLSQIELFILVIFLSWFVQFLLFFSSRICLPSPRYRWLVLSPSFTRFIRWLAVANVYCCIICLCFCVCDVYVCVACIVCSIAPNDDSRLLALLLPLSFTCFDFCFYDCFNSFVAQLNAKCTTWAQLTNLHSKKNKNPKQLRPVESRAPES